MQNKLAAQVVMCARSLTSDASAEPFKRARDNARRGTIAKTLANVWKNHYLKTRLMAYLNVTTVDEFEREWKKVLALSPSRPRRRPLCADAERLRDADMVPRTRYRYRTEGTVLLRRVQRQSRRCRDVRSELHARTEPQPEFAAAGGGSSGRAGGSSSVVVVCRSR